MPGLVDAAAVHAASKTRGRCPLRQLATRNSPGSFTQQGRTSTELAKRLDQYRVLHRRADRDSQTAGEWSRRAVEVAHDDPAIDESLPDLRGARESNEQQICLAREHVRAG